MTLCFLKFLISICLEWLLIGTEQKLCESLADSLLQLHVACFSFFRVLVLYFTTLNSTSASEPTLSLPGSEQKAIKTMLTIVTSEFKTFDVVLNT